MRIVLVLLAAAALSGTPGRDAEIIETVERIEDTRETLRYLERRLRVLRVGLMKTCEHAPEYRRSREEPGDILGDPRVRITECLRCGHVRYDQLWNE